MFLSMYLFHFHRNLSIPIFGKKWRQRGLSEWNLLTTYFLNTVSRVRSEMISWTWWNSLAWSQSLHPLLLTWSTSYLPNWVHHLKVISKLDLPRPIHALCIFNFQQDLFLLVFLHNSSRVVPIGVLELLNMRRSRPTSFKGKPGSNWFQGNSPMTWSWFARKDSSTSFYVILEKQNLRGIVENFCWR